MKIQSIDNRDCRSAIALWKTHSPNLAAFVYSWDQTPPKLEARLAQRYPGTHLVLQVAVLSAIETLAKLLSFGAKQRSDEESVSDRNGMEGWLRQTAPSMGIKFLRRFFVPKHRRLL